MLAVEKARTCLSRWFGKMGPGSMRSSTLSLAVSAVGGGKVENHPRNALTPLYM